ncbi:MAG: FAD-dependent oxidoreductase, partial [Bryobacteraceae bacterium]
AELARRGFTAAVIDKRDLAGGLNTYGVAEYKFRPADSAREIELVRSLGVEFRLGVEVTSVEELEKEFDLLFIGVGLGATGRLGIPGESLDGVVDALHFIAEYKTNGGVRVGRRVAIVGGGNTAIDAATAACRLGAVEVHMLYRRGESEMPAFRFEFELAKQDGVVFHWNTQPVAIHGASAVESVECARMESMRPVEGSNFRLDCDMVIPSIGQSKLVEFLARCRGVGVDRGRVACDARTGATANPRYYAGGDCVNGGREVVDAVAEGKRAALAMARRLEEMYG